MKAVITAAGSGTRLRPLTDHTPKCLLDIAGYTTLGLSVENILKQGIDEFVLVVGFEHNKIREYLKANYSAAKVEYILNEDYETTNSLYSFWMTRDAINGDSLLLLDGDIIFGQNVVEAVLNCKYDNCLSYRSGIEVVEEDMKLVVDNEGIVTQISKKIDLEIASGESIAIQKFSKEGVRQLIKAANELVVEEKIVNDWYEGAFQRMIDNGAEIGSITVDESTCFEIDTFEDIEYAKKYIIPSLQKD